MYLRLNFDIDNNKYWVSTVNDEGEDTLVPFMLAKPEELPRGVYITDVKTLNDKKRTEGIAFIQFFPTGYTENAVVHLQTRNEDIVTLVVQPLTGRTKIENKYVELSNATPSSQLSQ